MQPRQGIPMFAVELFPHGLSASVNLQNITHIFWEELRDAEERICWIHFPVRGRSFSRGVEGSFATSFPRATDIIYMLCLGLEMLAKNARY